MPEEWKGDDVCKDHASSAIQLVRQSAGSLQIPTDTDQSLQQLVWVGSGQASVCTMNAGPSGFGEKISVTSGSGVRQMPVPMLFRSGHSPPRQHCYQLCCQLGKP
jgi:hypothetical protein